MFLIGLILILTPFFMKNKELAYHISALGLLLAAQWSSSDINPLIFTSGLVMGAIALLIAFKGDDGDLNKIIPLSVVGLSLASIHTVSGLGILGVIIVVGLHVAFVKWYKKVQKNM